MATQQLSLVDQVISDRNTSLSGYLSLQKEISRLFSNPWQDGSLARRYREQVILKVDSDTAMTVAMIMYGKDEAYNTFFWNSLKKQPTGYLVLTRDTANKTKENWIMGDHLFASLSEAKEYGTFKLCAFKFKRNPARTEPVISRWGDPMGIENYPLA